MCACFLGGGRLARARTCRGLLLSALFQTSPNTAANTATHKQATTSNHPTTQTTTPQVHPILKQIMTMAINRTQSHTHNKPPNQLPQPTA